MWDGATAGCGAWVRTDGEPAGRAEVECSSGPRCQDRRRTPIQRPMSALGTHGQMRSKARDPETTRRHHGKVAYLLHSNPPEEARPQLVFTPSVLTVANCGSSPFVSLNPSVKWCVDRLEPSILTGLDAQLRAQPTRAKDQHQPSKTV